MTALIQGNLIIFNLWELSKLYYALEILFLRYDFKILCSVRSTDHSGYMDLFCYLFFCLSFGCFSTNFHSLNPNKNVDVLTSHYRGDSWLKKKKIKVIQPTGLYPKEASDVFIFWGLDSEH
jgi:hypothetical protein